MSWNSRIERHILQRRKDDQYRTRRATKTREGGRIILLQNGEQEARYLNFSSNDYLGLSHDLRLIHAWQEGARKYGVGSAGSGHITGYSEPLFELEERLADWLGYDAAIVYPSGFTANQAVIKLLIEQNDRIIADRLSHASLLEAAIYSPGRVHRFKHNDLTSLKSYLDRGNAALEKLETPENHGLLAVTEGVFSMDGDFAPLKKMESLCQEAGALFMVDDAHGIGVCGEGGRGSINLAQIKPDILVVTFGKAFGLSGAAVLVNEPLADYFVQFSRPLIYSTAIPPALAYTLKEAVDLIEKGDNLRNRLADNIAYYRQEMASLDLAQWNVTLVESTTAIQPLIIGESQRALEIAEKMQSQGIWVTAIRPPTVPPNSARLRITLTAKHQQEDIDALVAAFKEALGE